MKHIKISMDVNLIENRKTIDMKDWYTKNFNTSLREVKEELNKQRVSPCSWGERLSIVKIVNNT